jgi:hypothetical protein
VAGKVEYLEKVAPEQEWEWRNVLVRQAKHAAFVESTAQPH